MNQHTRPFLLAGAVTLLLSFPAMVAFMTLFTKDLSRTLELASNFRIQIIAGFAAMFLFLFLTPGAARACTRSAFVTGAYFIAVFLIGVLAASATNLMANPPQPWETPEGRRHSYLVKPIWALAMFGSLPAFFVGLLGWVLIRAFGRGRPSAGPAT